LCEGCKTCWGQSHEQEQSSRASSERSQAPVATRSEGPLRSLLHVFACFQVPCKAHSICPLVLWAVVPCSTIHGCALQATPMPQEHVEMAAHDARRCLSDDGQTSRSSSEGRAGSSSKKAEGMQSGVVCLQNVLPRASSFAWRSALYLEGGRCCHRLMHSLFNPRASNLLPFLGCLGLHCCLSCGRLPFLYLHYHAV
jgi:hypothetical protein